MKRSNFAYVGMWYGGGLGLGLLLLVVGYAMKQAVPILIGFLLLFSIPFVLPGLLRRRMEKNARALEDTFSQNGFQYQNKFTSNSGVFYIDQGGRMGVVWRDNPTALQFVDLTQVSEVRTNNGQQLNGTSLVSCQFKVSGKKHKIYTLRVSNGQLAMKDPRVVEAIQKADNLCALLNGAMSAAKV